MTRDRSEARSCLFKRRHASKAEAKAAARRLQADLGPGHVLRPYACGYCGKYHIGHTRRLSASTALHKAQRKEASS